MTPAQLSRDKRLGLTWIAKTSAYTALSGDGILADTDTTGAFTVTLPASPSVGDLVGIIDSKSNFATNNLTVGRNSSNIMGEAEDLTLDVDDTNFTLVYSGSTQGWIIETYLNVQNSNSGMRGYIDGLVLSNNGTDGDHDIDVAAGEARDSTNAKTLSLTASITKQIDATWAVGTNAGGLDTGSVAADTWYHVWLIMRSDTGVVDALFSTSASSPTMPTNYDYKRRIGAVLTDGSSNILGFSQMGDQFLWGSPIYDVNAGSIGITAVTPTISTPLGVKTIPLFTVITGNKAASQTTLYVSSPDVTDNAVAFPYVTNYSANSGAVAFSYNGALGIRTNTSSQIRVRAALASSSYYVCTSGWIDPRGKDA